MTEGSTHIRELIDLTGRRAFVTGGGRGIGAAVAARLVEAGAEVTVGDIDPSADAAAAAIGANFCECDITDPGSLAAAIDRAGGSDATLHILVNNAGIFPTTGPMLEATDEFVARMLDVNVRAHFSTAREAARRMPAGSAIVNLASIAGLGAGPYISAYAASKAAVMSLTRSFAHELVDGFGDRAVNVGLECGLHRHVVMGGVVCRGHPGKTRGRSASMAFTIARVGVILHDLLAIGARG